MADNPFAKKFGKKKSDHDGDEEDMPKGKHKMPDGKMMPGRMHGKGKPSGKGNPFAKKLKGKHPPPKGKGRAAAAAAKKARLQKFSQKY